MVTLIKLNQKALIFIVEIRLAEMAELVDALDSKSSEAQTS